MGLGTIREAVLELLTIVSPPDKPNKKYSLQSQGFVSALLGVAAIRELVTPTTDRIYPRRLI
jgi:hypothetical protein